MKTTFLALFALTACTSPDEKEWTDVPNDSGSTQPDSGQPVDTGTAPILPDAGEWGMAEPQILSDSCGVNDYQDVLEFVPKTLTILNPTPSGFELDDGSACSLAEEEFVCATQNVNESALSGTATLVIESTLSGKIENSTRLDTQMDVLIQECQGGGCVLIEMALTFPCPIQLETQASKL